MPYHDAVVVVHNGVIENFAVLRERLEAEGYRFRTATDTEVIAHLIASCLEKRVSNEVEEAGRDEAVVDRYGIDYIVVREVQPANDIVRTLDRALWIQEISPYQIYMVRR